MKMYLGFPCISKNKRYYKFIMPNPTYGKGLDTTKSFSSLYDRESMLCKLSTNNCLNLILIYITIKRPF